VAYTAQPVSVQLSPFEVLHAAQVGIGRAVSALRDGRPLEDGRLDLSFERHILGAVGEYAVARATDCCWRPAVGRLDTLIGDVGQLQVKATARPGGHLIVRPHDPASFVYVLAIIKQACGLVVTLMGWVPGSEAKVEAFWRERDLALGVHRPGYWVPQAHLHPMSELPGGS
jgi:hypothetical protein